MNTSLTKEQLKGIRKQLGLSQEDMGKRLRVTREWIGMLERGDRPISAAIILEIENLRREHSFVIHDNEGSPSEAREDPAPYGLPSTIRREIERHQEELIAAAGDDTTRLGWIREQQRAHLAIPRHWQKQSGPARSEEDEAAYQARIDALKATMPRVEFPKTSDAQDQREAGQGA